MDIIFPKYFKLNTISNFTDEMVQLKTKYPTINLTESDIQQINTIYKNFLDKTLTDEDMKNELAKFSTEYLSVEHIQEILTRFFPISKVILLSYSQKLFKEKISNTFSDWYLDSKTTILINIPKDIKIMQTIYYLVNELLGCVNLAKSAFTDNLEEDEIKQENNQDTYISSRSRLLIFITQLNQYIDNKITIDESNLLKKPIEELTNVIKIILHIIEDNNKLITNTIIHEVEIIRSLIIKNIIKKKNNNLQQPTEEKQTNFLGGSNKEKYKKLKNIITTFLLNNGTL